MTTKFPAVAIHAHVFYADLWPELYACIKNFISICGKYNVSVVITHPKERDDAATAISRLPPPCSHQIIETPNRGYDIGPFICEFINKIDFQKYDFIVKLHTKRDTDHMWTNFRPFYGSAWRRTLLSFCSTKQRARDSLAAFARHPKIGMVAPLRVINFGGYDCLDIARSVSAYLQSDFSLAPRHLVTVAGSMFMVRAILIKSFQGKYTWDDFISVDSSNAHITYGLAGLMEHAFPMMVDAQGFLVSEGHWSPCLAMAGYYFQMLVYGSLRKTSDVLTKLRIGTALRNVIIAVQRRKR